MVIVAIVFLNCCKNFWFRPTYYGSHLLWSVNTVSANLPCALTMECEHSRCEPAVCTYYGLHLLWSSHLLWSANTVGANLLCALTMVRTYYGVRKFHTYCVHLLWSANTVGTNLHSKCMGTSSVWKSQEVCLTHSKCMEQYQVRGSHSRWDRVHGTIFKLGMKCICIQTLYQVHTHIKCMGITLPMAECLDAYYVRGSHTMWDGVHGTIFKLDMKCICIRTLYQVHSHIKCMGITLSMAECLDTY